MKTERHWRSVVKWILTSTCAVLVGGWLVAMPWIARSEKGVAIWLGVMLNGVFFLTPLLIITWYFWWAERQPGRGQCRHCGYDLRGNVSEFCPECGTRR